MSAGEFIDTNSNLVVSSEMRKYHEDIKENVQEILKIASKARNVGLDPTKDIEIYIAQDVASRTEGLVGPRGVAKRFKEMENENLAKDDIVVKIAKEIANGKFGEDTPEELADQAIRTALSYQTEGITAAPIEGIAKVRIKSNSDGSQYLAVYYAGPIRSAGGTAQGVSIYLADIIRKELKLSEYRATDQEVERMLEEVRLYDKIMHLQLPTSDDEIRYAWKNMPIMIHGDPTEKAEVSGYRDIESMETNRVRGGACLVLNDGLVGRAKKITKRIKSLKLSGWDWLEEIGLGKYTHARETDVLDGEQPTEVKPDYSFTSDALMGRPTFSDATTHGGWRLRYGHSRNTGLAAIGVHPGLMAVVNDFLAPGTHIRTERPGKGSIVVPVDTIRPPLVLLSSGEVIEVSSYEHGVKIREDIDQILFLGDLLIGYGEFLQNDYRLSPAGYCEEWWMLEMIEAGWKDLPPDNHILFFEDVMRSPPKAQDAISLAKSFSVSLHPRYTPAWKYLSHSELELLHSAIWDTNKLLPQSIKPLLEKIFIPHQVVSSGIEIGDMLFALRTQLPENSDLKNHNLSIIDLINTVSDVTIKDTMGTTIGARMGRPEKAKPRLMSPKLHGLFPIGDDKKVKRTLGKALDVGQVSVYLSNRYCDECQFQQWEVFCKKCRKETRLKGRCTNRRCGATMEEAPCDHCGSSYVSFSTKYEIDVVDLLNPIRSKLGTFLEAGVKLKDRIKNPTMATEALEKGILRSKYDLHVFRDGTIRYDATDAPLTHFYPREIGTSIDKLLSLGYLKDILGDPLTHKNQLVEMKAQDIIVHESSLIHFNNVANFVDDELSNIYGQDPYYSLKKSEDIVGHLVIGLAPHTSAGVIGRIIGFTKSSVCWAHPFWHASKRRNCVDYNEVLLVYNELSKQLQKIVIGEFIDKLIEEGHPTSRVDDYGTLTICNPYPHLKSLSISESNYRSILQPIKNWVVGTSNDWVTITTDSGSRLKMTGDHQQLVWVEETKQLARKKAFDLVESDVLLSRSPFTELSETPLGKIDLIPEFSEKLPDDPPMLTSRKQLNSSLFFDPIKSIHRDKVTAKSYCVEIGDNTLNRFDHNISLLNAPVTGQCDGDEDGLILLMDGFLNFSKSYLPTTRGSKMDTPLVLVVTLNPIEVDDEAFNLDSVSYYPLELYKAAEKMEKPGKIIKLIERAEDRLLKLEQFEGFSFSHLSRDISEGPLSSKYKDPNLNIREKLHEQLKLAKSIRAVNERDSALRVLERHVLPDLMGNLRAFASQKVRCVNCNTKYRRVPVSGKCTNRMCRKSNLILTVFPKSVQKYYDICYDLIENYNLGIYHQNRLAKIKLALDSHFQDEEDEDQIQLDLNEWF